MPTNDHDQPAKSTGSYNAPNGDIGGYPNPGRESAKLGYETTDVNAGGIVVFIGGLFGFVLIFFVFCFFLGKVINTGLAKDDGPTDKWHQQNNIFAGAKANHGTRENLKSSAAMEQQQLGAVTAAFPGPQLQTDDGNQATADLHAREDLLLDFYTKAPGQAGIRIPIDRAMQQIVDKGLPVQPANPQETQLAYDKKPAVTAPLTSGFARTGYELETMEARQQRLDYGKASANAHAELHASR